jgi:hypothetical protein
LPRARTADNPSLHDFRLCKLTTSSGQPVVNEKSEKRPLFFNVSEGFAQLDSFQVLTNEFGVDLFRTN